MDHKGHVALVWPIKHPVFQPSEERNWWCCCHCCARYQRLLPLLGKISKAATLSVSRSHLHSWPRMCLPTLHNLPLDKWERNYFPATGRSLYVAGCGFSLIEGGIIGLAWRQRLRHTCAESPSQEEATLLHAIHRFRRLFRCSPP